MNQSTANPNQPQIIRLPLSKFSHTTTTIDHTGPLLWNHVNTAGDLACVLEYFMGGASIPARLFIRVVRNDGILEQLDLSYFARLLAAQSQSGQGTFPIKPPFAVVVKSPCLAVKYPHSNTHIRRFQIKFSHETDYFAALSLLSQANCPFTEGSTAAHPLQRPLTSSSWTSYQAPLTASKAASTNVTSDAGTPVPFFPMPSYMPEMTGMRPGLSTIDVLNRPLAPNPPSSAPGTIQSTRGRNTRARGNRFGSGSTHRSNQSAATSSSKQTVIKIANTRLTTAPAFHGQQLDEMLPPKRDLPFLKSSQKDSQPQESEMSGVSPSTPLDRLPDHASKNQALVSTIEDSMVIKDSQASNSQSQSIILTQQYPNPTLPALALSSQVQDTQLSEIPGFDTTMATESQGGVSLSGGEMIPMTQALEGIENDLRGITCAKGKEVSSTVVVSEDQLASYLSAPTPERVAFLENWMCELIEDDKFLTLCQDVESTWRRFAFGTKEN